MHLKMLSVKWRPFCPGQDELNLFSTSDGCVPIRPAIKRIKVTDYKNLDCFPGFISKAYKIFKTFRYSIYKIPEVKNIANNSPNKMLYKELNKQKG